MDLRARRWLLILLVPLAPVVLLYLLFDKQNYFQLYQESRGLLVVGPIGIYLLLVLIGAKLFVGLNPDPIPRQLIKRLCGEWTFESTSRNLHSRTGNCSVSYRDGRLDWSGDFREEGKIVGLWHGEIMDVRGSIFLMVYSLGTIGVGGQVYGLVQIVLPPNDFTQLEGTWNVVGREGQEGSITYTRKAASQ